MVVPVSHVYLGATASDLTSFERALESGRKSATKINNSFWNCRTTPGLSRWCQTWWGPNGQQGRDKVRQGPRWSLHDLAWTKYESLMHADMYRVVSSFLASNISCSFSRGDLTVLVFALDPDSLMMSAACL